MKIYIKDFKIFILYISKDENMSILEEMIFKNYVLDIDVDTLYFELLEETIQARGENLGSWKFSKIQFD